MILLILKWLLNGAAFVLTAKVVDMLLPNTFRLDGFEAALIAALLLGLVNTFIRPLLKLLTLPITFLTLGLFSLVINGLMLKLVDSFVSGMTIVGFFPAVLGALVLSFISGVLTIFL